MGKAFAGTDEGDGDRKLCEELGPGAHRFAIIQEAQKVDKKRGGEEEHSERGLRTHAGNVGVDEPLDRCGKGIGWKEPDDRDTGEEGDRETPEDADAAIAGRGDGVNFAVTGVVH